MNQPSRQLLNKLLHSWQSDPQRPRKVHLPITPGRALPYFQATLPDEKDALHAGLEEAAGNGCVSLEWGKGYESHILKRITLEDGAALACYLGVPLASEQAGQARQLLQLHLSGRESWIEKWLGELLERWSRNQPLSGIAPGDTVSAVLMVKALEAVAAGRQRNLDLRTFSSRELGNSKAMESLLPRFAAVWKKFHPSELTNDELFQTLGLVKFPQPLLLRGPVVLKLASRNLACQGIVPFLGLPPRAIQGVTPDSPPDYCLTIENLASFNRYTSEIEDRGLIIYTGGFPSPGVADFLRLLDCSLPASVPFSHWGDIDEGGVKILAYVQGLLGRAVQPHLMTPKLLSEMGQQQPALRVSEIKRIGEVNEAARSIVEAMLSTDPPMVLEQENVDPSPPKLSL